MGGGTRTRGLLGLPQEKRRGGSPISESNGVRQTQLHQNWLPVPGSDGGAGWLQKLQTAVKCGCLGVRCWGSGEVCGSSKRPQIPLRDRSGKQFL